MSTGLFWIGKQRNTANEPVIQNFHTSRIKIFWPLQQVFGKIAEHKKHVAVDELESILKDNKEALILDLGAGTGIIGQMVDYCTISTSCKY